MRTRKNCDIGVVHAAQSWIVVERDDEDATLFRRREYKLLEDAFADAERCLGARFNRIPSRFVDATGRTFNPATDVAWTVTDVRGNRADDAVSTEVAPPPA